MRKIITWLVLTALLAAPTIPQKANADTQSHADDVLIDAEYKLIPCDENAAQSVTEGFTAGEEKDEAERSEEALDWHTLDVEVTAYCGCEKCNGQWTGYPTASGVYPQERHTVAVDPDVIPLGSWIVIDGEWYHAEDTGAFRGNVIDLYMADHEAALEFGRQKKTVKWTEE